MEENDGGIEKNDHKASKDQDEPAITRTPLMLPELLQFLIGDVLRIRVRCNLLGLPAFVIE